jgi:hypothetical protein
MPVNAGIQNLLKILDPGVRRDDGMTGKTNSGLFTAPSTLKNNSPADRIAPNRTRLDRTMTWAQPDRIKRLNSTHMEFPQRVATDRHGLPA